MKVVSSVSLLLASLIVDVAYAEERAYPVIDAQGRVQILKSDVPTSEKKTEITNDKKIIVQPKTKSSQSDTFRSLDDDVYVDSEYLEQKNFNLEDKKRFYYVPNGALGQQVIESDNNTPSASSSSVIRAKKTRREAFYSDSYQVIDEKIIDVHAPVIKSFCQQSAKLKKYLRPFKEINPLWLGTDSSIHEDIDRALVLPESNLAQKQLRISSFATTNKKPKFYVPIVSFLDGQGCFLSGAWQYWSRAYPATEHQFASVEGLLVMPKNTKYVVFSRPDSKLSAGLPQQQSGSLVIENE